MQGTDSRAHNAMISFDPFPVLETPRLVLRQIVDADAEALFRISSDPEVMRYYGRAPEQSIDETMQRIEKITASIREFTSIRWALTLRESGELIGGAGFWRWNKQHFLAEIGYELLPAHWGRGLMTEALRPIFRFGFEAMELHRVEANIHPANRASARVLERLGFVQEGLLREAFCQDGLFTDNAVYGLLQRDFVDDGAPAAP